MNHITNETIVKIEDEFTEWAETLNNMVGVVLFNLGVSCLGSPYPIVTATVSAAFAFLLFFRIPYKFPPTLKELRKKKLQGDDKGKLDEIEKKHLGFVALLKNFNVFFAGWLFLVFVCFYEMYFQAKLLLESWPLWFEHGTAFLSGIPACFMLPV